MSPQNKRETITMAEFDSWAAYYDYLHPGLPGEDAFFGGQALMRGGPVLEVGCGTGRIAIPMAMSGLNVTGIDNSSAMLTVCREKAALAGVKKKNLALMEADMRDFDLNTAFPLIIMAYRTFMHCLSVEEQLNCLRCIYNHLLPGGEFFCSLWAAQPAQIAKYNPAPDFNTRTLVDTIFIPPEDITLVHYVSVRRDDFRQLLCERHWVREQDSNGNTLHEEELSMTRAWVTPREMEHLIARTGFEIMTVLGDFNGVPWSANHTEMIWHLRRSS